MRTPTDRAALYAFWTDALRVLLEHHCESLKEANRRGIEIPAIPDEPQCGFYRTRLIRGGPWLVARVYLRQLQTKGGELAGDEVLICEIAGREYDPESKWLHLCDRPISQVEFQFGVGHRKWSEDQRPHAPRADHVVDWYLAPSPTFPKRRKTKDGSRTKRAARRS